MDWKKLPVIKLYIRQSRAGIDAHTPVGVARYMLVANSVNLTTITLILPYSVLFYCMGVGPLAVLLGSFFFLFLFYHYLAHKRHYFLSRLLSIISMNIILGAYAVALGRLSSLHMLYLVFFTLPFFVFSIRHYRVIIFCCLLSLAGFCFVRFEVFPPMVLLSERAMQVIGSAMMVLTFGWLLLNTLYLIRAHSESEKRLREANRLLKMRNSDLVQFANVASHDLQEPLRIVASFTGLLERQYAPQLDDVGRQYMGFIVQSVHRLKLLIKELRDYARLGEGLRAERVNTYHLLREVEAGLQALMDETQAVISCDQLPTISGYKPVLKILFHQLLLNAITYRQPGIAPRIHVSATKTNSHWQFAVTDNGIGIAPGHHERIFVIFQSLQPQSPTAGIGIGLAYCKKIVELHSGHIWVESEPGNGSTFYFTLAG